jgi:hypothetical protein
MHSIVFNAKIEMKSAMNSVPGPKIGSGFGFKQSGTVPYGSGFGSD